MRNELNFIFEVFNCLSEAKTNTLLNITLKAYILLHTVHIKTFNQAQLKKYLSDLVLILTECTYEGDSYFEIVLRIIELN